jgi:hypothetical protein
MEVVMDNIVMLLVFLIGVSLLDGLTFSIGLQENVEKRLRLP